LIRNFDGFHENVDKKKNGQKNEQGGSEMEHGNTGSSRAYELRIVALIFFAWGFLFLDRSALSYIMPAILEDLQLTNGQIGQINMWQTIGFAVSGPLIAMLSDRSGKRKPILLAAIFATALFSGLSALANTYPMLLAMRFLVGASEGPILPLAMTLVAAESRENTFGRNAGIVNTGVGVIAYIVGPVLVTQSIAALNWHWAFVIISVPSFLLGVLIWKFAKEVRPRRESQNPQASRQPQAPQQPNDWQPEAEAERRVRFWEVFKYRNVLVCILISISFCGGYWILNAFSPLYLTTAGQMSIEQMGVIMSTMGVAGIVAAVGIPMLSDYIGRKTVSILFPALGALAPLGLYLFPTEWPGPAALIVFGPMFGSMVPIFMNIIPQESVPVQLKATASALIIGIGEIVGSFIVGAAGTYADLYGLAFVLLVSAAAAVLMAILGLGLKETLARKFRTQDQPVLEQAVR
jgi:predicted MFS family arabinose efflux permease